MTAPTSPIFCNQCNLGSPCANPQILFETQAALERHIEDRHPQSQDATGEVLRIVKELRETISFGKTAVRRSVELINEYQKKFGKSRKQLEKLAKLVGADVATLYRWKKSVEHPAATKVERPCFKTAKSPNGHTTFELLSWLQKSIRRGHLGDKYVDDALYAAVELDLTGFPNAVWNRLLIIASEDIGQADRLAIVETEALFLSYQHLKKTGNKHFPERLPLIDAVLRLATAPQVIQSTRKSRMVDHALNVVYNERPSREVPEYVFDKHTPQGANKSVEDFLDSEAAAPIVDPDRWLEDAKRILVAKESGAA
jgi:replication-associated recombination protein RarA